jgi:hypothetical protein
VELKPYVTTPENAERIADWLRNRGGIVLWQSIDFNRAGQTLTTPATTADGEPHPKPAYWVASAPIRAIVDPADVFISHDVEVKRFRVGLRTGSNGMQIKCTDGATRRIRAAIEKAGGGAYHEFDYMTQEAVIYKPESQVPLLDHLSATVRNSSSACA